MAHQAKQGVHVELPHKTLLKRPELAALLGVVASEWSSLEANMTFLYGSILGKTMPHNRAEGPPVHPIGLQIFETLANHKTRLVLIEKLAHQLIKDADLLRDLTDEVLPALRKASKKRNNLVHACWGINDDEYPNELMKILSPGEFEIYDKSDFSEAIDFIIETAMTVSKFENRVVKYFKIID